ncbi:MAG: AAA family ATPase [Terriglobia bacterium]
MIIKNVSVRNFRSIYDATLPCEQLTALVGPNGSGKSSFLRGIELFYMTSPKFSAEDFYGADTSRDIEVAVTFADLDQEESTQFSSYLESGELTVVRVLSLADGKVSAKYHGSTLQHPDFVQVREAGKAADKKSAYEQLRKNARYADLPAWTKQDDAIPALKKWEGDHADQCTRQRDDGQFFGFTEVAQGYLGRYTRFIPIHAVRDAADDATESKGSPTTELMDLVVRSALANREDLKKLKEETDSKYKEIMKPGNLAELSTLEERLTRTLRAYVPDAAISLSWIEAGGIEVPLPKAEVKLVEDGYPSSVTRTGHGLQRAFILTLLQHLAIARVPTDQKAGIGTSGQAESSGKTTVAQRVPNLILGIEEPELYQHPNRQRHLAKILLALATGSVAGVARKTQIIYSTHSPFFVGIDRFEQIRVLRKVRMGRQRPKVTQRVQATLDEVAQILWEAVGKPGTKFTGETLRPRLQTIMTPWMNEGFFSEVVVLVEGEEDRAAILGTAAPMKCDLESEGVSVIPCMGKNNLDRPTVIFRQFEIPTYLIWDSDESKKNAKPEQNRYLLRLVGQPEEDWPGSVGDCYACFKNNLHTTLREEIGGDLFDTIVQRVQEETGLSEREQAIKNPTVMGRVIEAAKKEGKRSTTLEEIVGKIRALKAARADT